MKFFSVSGATVATFNLDYDEALITNAIKNWKPVPDEELTYPTTLPNFNPFKRAFFGYKHNFDFLGEAKLTKLKKNFQECCDLYTEKVNLDKIVITNSWFGILNKGSEVEFHEHLLDSPVLLGVYYFKIGKGSSPLVLQNKESNLKLHPYNGRFILFPGWMKHGVEVNKSLERGCIGFNTKSILAIKRDTK